MELCSRVPRFKKYSMNILNLLPIHKHSAEIGAMKFSKSRVECLPK